MHHYDPPTEFKFEIKSQTSPIQVFNLLSFQSCHMNGFAAGSSIDAFSSALEL
jgi:hypothetical protein